jgi:hypothetical protein
VIRRVVEQSMINGREPLTNEQKAFANFYESCSIHSHMRWELHGPFPHFPMVATSSSIVKKVINEKTADISDAARLIRFNFTFDR